MTKETDREIRSIDVLPCRRLGRTNAMVTSLGIGGAALSRGYTTPSSDADAVVTTNRAAELGIGYIDTAPGYGESERRIGLAFKENPKLRSQFFLATKVVFSAKDYTADIHRSVENSLKLMNTDWIDLLQLHSPHCLELILESDGPLTVLKDLKEQGVIRGIGVGISELDLLLKAIEHGGFDTVLTYKDFNLVRQTARDTLFAASEKHDVAIVLGSPILCGWLSNRPEEKILKSGRPPDDPEVMEVRRISRWAREKGVKLMSLALQYCLRDHRVPVTLVGTRNVEQVEEMVESVLDPLPESIWEELREELGIE